MTRISKKKRRPEPRTNAHETENARLAQSIGTACRDARVQLGLTQKEVAHKIGRSLRFYALVERGHMLPGIETLKALAEALDLSVDAILRAAGFGDSAREDPPEIQRLASALERASPDTIRAVSAVLRAAERNRRKT